jgi:HNH endonuclease
MFDSLPQRIRDKIVFTPCPIPGLKGDCWVWVGYTSYGYGITRLNGRLERVHRVSLFFAGIEIPKGLEPDHLCRVRACCNIDHLELVTRRINLLRGDTVTARNAAKTHCIRGHEFTSENTVIYERNCRRCRTCFREHMRRVLSKWTPEQKEKKREYDRLRRLQSQ